MALDTFPQSCFNSIDCQLMVAPLNLRSLRIVTPSAAIASDGLLGDDALKRYL